MQQFTDRRTADTPDEIWFLEHAPVFTLGMNASRAHLLAPGDIPVVQVDRGGQVTYHGPGQLVVYPLVDLRRARLGVRDFVTALERAVIDRPPRAASSPSAARGTRGLCRRREAGQCRGARAPHGGYHGLALNVNLDLAPFARINPCGYAGLRMTQLSALGGPRTVAAAGAALEPHLLRTLGLGRVTIL